MARAGRDPLVVEPLSRARLPEVIQRPAQRAGLQFAPGLVERMVEDTTGGGSVRSPGGEKVPPEYADKIFEYYRKLGKAK